MDEKTKLAFESAQDVTKQLIGLATGFIALTITFSKDFLGDASSSDKTFAYLAWVFFLLSIVFGLWTLLAMTGTLASKASEQGTPADLNVTLPASLQVIGFLIGLALSVVFGAIAAS